MVSFVIVHVICLFVLIYSSYYADTGVFAVGLILLYLSLVLLFSFDNSLHSTPHLSYLTLLILFLLLMVVVVFVKE